MKDVIKTASSPKAIGPYSQAIKANNFLFISGQLGLDPTTGLLVSEEITQQTERVLENLLGILAAAGSSMSKVLKTTVFLADLGDFSAMNEVYARYFPCAPPARSTVEVSRLPRDARIEIDLIARM